MTFKEIIDAFSAAGIPDPVADGRVLWRELSGENPLFIPKATDSSSSKALIKAVERRTKREPLQYILGTVAFYKEEYEVSPDCLIPRQDTEILVDLAVKLLPYGARFADLCTGSGCVAVSTLKNTRGTSCLAVDVSCEALKLTQKNAVRNGVADRLMLSRIDLLTKGGELKSFAPFDAVLSNPPYVSLSAYSALEEEIYKEPKIAFLGGEDGGDFYRALVPLGKELIKDNGFIAFEIGYDQGELLKALADEADMTSEIIKDYSGLDRVALLRKKS